MAKICTISDNESDTSDNQDDTTQTETNTGAWLIHSQPHPPVLVGPKGVLARHRNHSMNEEDLQESAIEKHESANEEGDLFRRRSRSAPPVLWAAKKYGMQLRRMSDEFDTLKDKEMKRVKSASSAYKMRPSLSWLKNLFSHKESDAEDTNNLTAPNSRPGE